jgi:transposase-like protein
MRRKSHATDLSSEEVVKDIRRATRKRYSAEEKIRIVLDGLRGEHSIAELPPRRHRQECGSRRDLAATACLRALRVRRLDIDRTSDRRSRVGCRAFPGFVAPADATARPGE